MSDLDKLITEIEARAAKATLEPWEAFERDVLGSDGTVVVETPRAFLVDVPTLEFIAAARTDVPALCRALRVALKRLGSEALDPDILAALKGEK